MVADLTQDLIFHSGIKQSWDFHFRVCRELSDVTYEVTEFSQLHLWLLLSVAVLGLVCGGLFSRHKHLLRVPLLEAVCAPSAFQNQLVIYQWLIAYEFQLFMSPDRRSSCWNQWDTTCYYGLGSRSWHILELLSATRDGSGQLSNTRCFLLFAFCTRCECGERGTAPLGLGT